MSKISYNFQNYPYTFLMGKYTGPFVFINTGTQ